MTPNPPSLAEVRASLRVMCAAMHKPAHSCTCKATLRLLDAVAPLLEDADVDWTTRTTEHEATLRALLRDGEGAGG